PGSPRRHGPRTAARGRTCGPRRRRSCPHGRSAGKARADHFRNHRARAFRIGAGHTPRGLSQSARCDPAYTTLLYTALADTALLYTALADTALLYAGLPYTIGRAGSYR